MENRLLPEFAPPQREASDTFLFFGLIVGLALAPFWLGGNRLPAWAANGLYFPALVIFFELGVLFAGRRHPVSIRAIAGPAALFGAAILWALFQASPASGAFAHPIWSMASEMLDRPVAGGVSIDPGQTLLFSLRLATAASVFWLSLQLSRHPARARLLLEAVALIVAAYAAYGLVLTGFFSAAIPFFDAPDQGLFVRSTFVNRNNFATYAGVGLVTTLALIVPLADQTSSPRAPRAYLLSRLVEEAGLRGWILLAAAFVTFVALLGTVSRGGLLAASLGIGAILAISYLRRRQGRRESAGSVLLVAAGLGATILFFGDLVVGRLAAIGFDDGRRLAVFSIAGRAILDTPLLGYGYGAFAEVFPLYRDRSIATAEVWDKAHNVYLEVWLGLGLVFGTALIGSLVWLAAKCFNGAVRRRRSPAPAAAAAACSLLVGFHSLVDFGVQMEAMALTFVALLGAGVAQTESSRISLSD